MGGLAEMKKERIHERNMRITTWSAGPDSIVVEGELADDRLMEYYLVTGEKRPPNRIHHMIIRLLLEGMDLAIKEVEVEMPGVPREECRKTASCLEPVAGLHIGPGFTLKVKAIAGGKKGCAHLVNLLLAMSSAAIQGYWAMRARKNDPAGSADAKVRAAKFLMNTCWVWRDDGDLIKTFR